ncbi:MAG: FdtA/QdtA family cupin domain-containing protein [Rickettsiales bacterium]|nr:FdtA/QdtA family cupin domain-containing protein [Rickettsiales bacterium]
MIKSIINFEIKGDERGSLISLEENKNIPFDIKRVYYIFGTKIGVRRGFHAHKKLKQLLVCVSGSCKVLLDDGKSKEEISLDTSSKGLLIESMIWREMFDFSPDCVSLVLANDYYDEDDYIRDYNQFLNLCKN